MYFNQFKRLLHQSAPINAFYRQKHKETHWSVVRKKIHPINKALDHFDDFYKDVFGGKKWKAIREGLLGKQKYVAVVNNYGNVEETVGKLELSGALNVRTLFHLEKEYIQEELTAGKRSRYLEEIWKRADDTKVASKPIENDTKVEFSAQRFSLEQSLKSAELDYSRIIDESQGMSAPILTEFLPVSKIKGRDDWVPESDHYKYYSESEDDKVVKIEREHDLNFPENLNVYCFEYENFSDFDPPIKVATGVYNYYLMDGGSLLPVLALDLKPGCKILDMCAAPGGKSLLALQTLYPDCVVCNDVSLSRTNRIASVMEQFLYDLPDRWYNTNRLKIMQSDGRNIILGNFDAVIVDVPCTTDRHSVKVNENNIFTPGRVKERLKLPELQSALLYRALELVRVGGTVVYSTCSLSPIQNDGVVHMALKQIYEETNLEFVVKDLSIALAQVKNVYQMADRKLMKYGHLVLPVLAQNYGPTYFCKLQRIQ